MLTVVEGSFFGDAVAQPFIEDVVPQVRLLVALPLLVFALAVIDPDASIVVRDLQSSGVTLDQEGFQAAVLKLERARDAVWPDVVILLLAYLLSWRLHAGYDALVGGTPASSWRWSIPHGHAALTWAGYWYALLSAPFFQFVLYRWVWRFLIWARFMYRVSRVPFRLNPAHPDLSSSIGVLGRGQQVFAIVFVAFAAVMSSTVAHNILVDGAAFHDSRPEIIAFVALCAVAIYAPLLFFAGDMYRARIGGAR